MVRYDRTIPPGGVGQVTLQVNTTGYQGKITKSAQVTTNDPRQRKSKIYLVINVRTYIIVEPGTKILLRGTVGEDIRRWYSIRATDDQPLEITKVQSNLRSAIDYKLNRKDDATSTSSRWSARPPTARPPAASSPSTPTIQRRRW